MITWKHFDCFPFSKKWKDVNINLIPGVEDIKAADKQKLEDHIKSGGKKQKSTKKKNAASDSDEDSESDKKK